MMSASARTRRARAVSRPRARRCSAGRARDLRARGRARAAWRSGSTSSVAVSSRARRASTRPRRVAAGLGDGPARSGWRCEPARETYRSGPACSGAEGSGSVIGQRHHRKELVAKHRVSANERSPQRSTQARISRAAVGQHVVHDDAYGWLATSRRALLVAQDRGEYSSTSSDREPLVNESLRRFVGQPERRQPRAGQLGGRTPRSSARARRAPARIEMRRLASVTRGCAWPGRAAT